MYDPSEVLKTYDKAIHKAARTYFKRSSRFSYDDLVAEAQTVALEANCSFVEGSKNASFFTYLTSSMNRQLQKFVAVNDYDTKMTEHGQRKAYKEHGSLEEHKYRNTALRLSDKPGDFIPCSGVSPDENLIKRESIEILRQEMDSLPDREKIVLNMRWMENKTLKEVATKLNTSRQAVHLWEKSGFAKLSKAVKIRLGNDLY